jgi:hypothetical protein
MAPLVACSRISGRSPSKSNRLLRVPAGPATPTKTRPTGLPSWVAGPATPVVLTPKSDPTSSRTPLAIASAHSAETTPCSSMTSCGTPRTLCLTSVA